MGPERVERSGVCAYYVASVVSNSLRPHGLQSARLLCPWDSSGKKIGVGCHAFLQGIFPTQGSNLLGGSDGKESTCNARDPSSIPG